MTTNSINEKALADFELLTTEEAARFLRVSVSFLSKARVRGDGPRYRKLSRSVRYTKTDLLLWLKACAKTSTAEGRYDPKSANLSGNEDE